MGLDWRKLCRNQTALIILVIVLIPLLFLLKFGDSVFDIDVLAIIAWAIAAVIVIIRLSSRKKM